MRSALTDQTFARLLDHLDEDRERAGERYEDLRRVLVRFFEWRGAPFPDEHADETFDRVARRLAEGVEVKNIGAYCYMVARLILLETRKGSDGRRSSLENPGAVAAADASMEAAEKETRLACLDDCMRGLPADSRELIIEYYRQDSRGRIDGRRALAERLGLKNRSARQPRAAGARQARALRDRLCQEVVPRIARTTRIARAACAVRASAASEPRERSGASGPPRASV